MKHQWKSKCKSKYIIIIQEILYIVIEKLKISTKWAEQPVFTICPAYARGFKAKLLNKKYGKNVTSILNFDLPNDLEGSKEFYEEISIAKIQATLGQKNFVNVYHDLTYS